MNLFTFCVVVTFAGMVAFVAYTLGMATKSVQTIKLLKEKGWTIEPPNENIECNETKNGRDH